MADLKISQLNSATTPLAGTEVVPLVQSASTKKISINDLVNGYAASTNPTFNAYVGTAQAISAATFTICNVDTEMFDTNACFDTTTHRFTPTVAGYYQVNAQVAFQSAATLVIASVFKTGSRGVVEGAIWTTSGLTTVSCAGVVYMDGVTDYLDLRAYSDSTANTVGDGRNSTTFSATLVRPA